MLTMQETAQATCSTGAYDPVEWDAPAYWDCMTQRPNMPAPARHLVAAALCGTCPVLAQCATDALGERPTGVIRAGIPVTQGKAQPWQLAAWGAIADGYDLSIVMPMYASEWRWDIKQACKWLSKGKGREVACGLLEEPRAWLEARGIDLPACESVGGRDE